MYGKFLEDLQRLFKVLTSKSDKNGETITISPRKILTKEITELFKVCILFHF